jgi:hypothetical protein
MLRREHCDAAILDVLIQGERVDPICQLLKQRGIPFGFATGVEEAQDDGPYRHAPRVMKPYEPDAIKELIGRLVGR